jgi:RNA polymerase primary sigma factor
MPTRKKTLPLERATAAVNIPSIETGLTVRPEIKPASPSQFDQASPVDRRDERSNLQLYLNEIRQTPLLTIAEEIQLAAAHQEGRQGGPRPHDQGQPAPGREDRLWITTRLGLPLMDLISEGNHRPDQGR